MIESKDKDFGICRQCKLLSINRRTLYYTPSTAPVGDLAIMRTMDELHSRFIVRWSLSNTREAEWVLNTLKQAVAEHGSPRSSTRARAASLPVVSGSNFFRRKR